MTRKVGHYTHVTPNSSAIALLAICEQVLGEDHPDTATRLNNLGLLLRDMGDLAGARTYLEQVLAIFEHVLGLDHPNTEAVRRNLARLDSPSQTREQQIAAIREQTDAAVASALASDDTQARAALAEQLEQQARLAEAGEAAGSPYLDLAAHLRDLIVRLRESKDGDAPGGAS